jgi:hypothetical protein
MTALPNQRRDLFPEIQRLEKEGRGAFGELKDSVLLTVGENQPSRDEVVRRRMEDLKQPKTETNFRNPVDSRNRAVAQYPRMFERLEGCRRASRGIPRRART